MNHIPYRRDNKKQFCNVLIKYLLQRKTFMGGGDRPYRPLKYATAYAHPPLKIYGRI